MGSTWGWLSTKPTSSSDTLREIHAEKKIKDSLKVQKFKRKVEIEKCMEVRRNTIDIIHDAFSELGITEDPITNFYTMDHIIGSGKYGVVKRGVSIVNPEFKVAIKIIDIRKLNS